MKILRIEEGVFIVGAVVHESGSGGESCPLLDSMNAVQRTEAASRDRLLEYFQLVALRGIDSLNDSQRHLVDRENKIYEFIAGRLRVLFFAGNPRSIIVCTHMFMKTTRKTPDAHVARARRAKAQYESDRISRAIEWKDEL